jgi:hypothetical protein
MNTIYEWYRIITELVADTGFYVIMKDDISNPVVAILPKGYESPQRVAIYPKKTKDAGLVIELDVLHIHRVYELLGEPARMHSNRPHYNNIPDEVIIEVVKEFLLRESCRKLPDDEELERLFEQMSRESQIEIDNQHTPKRLN